MTGGQDDVQKRQKAPCYQLRMLLPRRALNALRYLLHCLSVGCWSLPGTIPSVLLCSLLFVLWRTIFAKNVTKTRHSLTEKNPASLRSPSPHPPHRRCLAKLQQHSRPTVESKLSQREGKSNSYHTTAFLALCTKSHTYMHKRVLFVRTLGGRETHRKSGVRNRGPISHKSNPRFAAVCTKGEFMIDTAHPGLERTLCLFCLPEE